MLILNIISYSNNVNNIEKDDFKFVRVALSNFKAEKLEFSSNKGFIIILDNTDMDYANSIVNIGINNGKIVYKDKLYSKIEIHKYEKDDLINISMRNKKHIYRGDFEISTESSRLLPINIVALDDYIYGVLPGEVSATFPDESLKAQAIISRSYTVYNKIHKKYKNFDVYDNVMSQVYLGYDYEKESINKLVDETKNKIILYNNEVIDAVFHSDSGGRTANNEDVWKGASLPYLRSINDDNSQYSPRKEWTAEITYDEIYSKTKIHPVDIKVEYNNSERLQKMIILGQDTNYEVDAIKFRKIFGESKIFSTNVIITNDENNKKIIVYGKGNGHGVGASQWGMYNLAKKGYDYQNIIKYYYKDVQIKDM